MRILHVAESIFGGVGTYLDEIGRSQSNVYGSQNVFFAVPEGSTEMLPSVGRRQIVELSRIGRTPAGLVRLGLSIHQVVREFNPDVVHLHSTFAGFAGRIALSVGRRRFGVLYCPHGWAFGMETGWLKRLVYVQCERLLASSADTIIVNSDFERALALEYGIAASRLRVIKNGISSVAPEPVERDERPPIQLAFVGRHDKQKGLDILLEELDRADCRHIHLHVVGKSVATRKSPLVGRPLKNITFHGWMSHSQIASLLTAMDAVVMPSRWEAFGLVAIEAMRAGVPVIASNRGGLPEVVRHGVDGFIFDVSQPGKLGDILAGLELEELRKLGIAAHSRFHATFTADRMNCEIGSTYSSVVAASCRRTGQLQANTLRSSAE